jgi:hypothetical protein
MHGSVTVAHLVTGNHLHGYGILADGREFAVRTSEGRVRLEVYRLDARQPVPDTTDVELVAERTARDVDLDDERSARAVVQDMALAAAPAAPSVRGVVRALGEALEAVTGISPADAPDTPARHH